MARNKLGMVQMMAALALHGAGGLAPGGATVPLPTAWRDRAVVRERRRGADSWKGWRRTKKRGHTPPKRRSRARRLGR